MTCRGAAAQIIFSFSVLAVNPAGIALALAMPVKSWKSSAVLVLVAISLLIPWNVVGTIWQITAALISA
jgi:glycerol transport system permease protein